MIEGLRFVEREVREPYNCGEQGVTHWVKRKILQAYDGHVWFDVPLEEADHE